MRKLSAKNKAFAAEKLGMAYGHLKVANSLIESGNYAASIAKTYYAAYFSAQCALADISKKPKNHNFWVGRFNKRFGKWGSWIPSSYAKMLNDLRELRKKHDYEGALPDNEKQARSFLRRTEKLLKKIRNNTPLLQYPEFVSIVFEIHPLVDGLEFDYYCPKSYIHKERVQIQVQAKDYDEPYCKRIRNAGKKAIQVIGASKQEDYVLGWNNRLGQNADAYLLFLDIDNNDEAIVKTALKGRKGWLFKSGEGFHFIGSEIYTSQKLWQYRFTKAAKSKKLKALVDHAHVEFSLKRGYSTLRMFASEVKPFVPFQCLDQS